MRIRCIKPEFWQSESLSRVSRDARLLFVGLFSACDDSGRTRAASRFLASLLFPYDEDVPKRIDGWLAELEKEGCIRRYIVDGNSYLEVPKWLSHQKIDKPGKSKIPAFADSSRVVGEDSRIVVVGSGIRDQGKDQGSKEEERAPGDLIAVPELGWSEADGWSGITQPMRNRWSDAFPACNIDRQLAQMDAWLRANPKEAKKKNWARFATNWLKREQDKGGDVRADRRVSAPVSTNPADALAQNQPIRIGFSR
jgi:hypothetical protein